MTCENSTVIDENKMGKEKNEKRRVFLYFGDFIFFARSLSTLKLVTLYGPNRQS